MGFAGFTSNRNQLVFPIHLLPSNHHRPMGLEQVVAIVIVLENHYHYHLMMSRILDNDCVVKIMA